MRRAAPLAALLIVALSTIAIVGTSLANRNDSSARGGSVIGASTAGVYPGLRTLAALGGPGGSQTDSGLGVYPLLARPAALLFPDADRIAAAIRFARSRDGEVTFAVARPRGGITGVGIDRPFKSASLTKSMLLVAFLRKVGREGRAPTNGELASLGLMIRVSDNSSADSIYRRTGDEELRALARAAGMRAFEIDGDWANATLSAADEARLFLELDRLVPRRYRGLARDILENVAPFHAWGVPAAARPGWRVWFKGGWRPEGDGELVHQGALVEGGGRRLALAVMTRGNVSQRYGEETIAGIARRLLAGAEPGLVATVPEGVVAPVAGQLAPLSELQ